MRLIKYPGDLPKEIDGVGSAKIDFNNRVCIFSIATINRNPVLILVKEIYSNLTPPLVSARIGKKHLTKFYFGGIMKI